MPQNYEHINRYEREIIAEMRSNGEGWNSIGARLGRAGSSVWREYQRNRSGEGEYFPHAADDMAEKRRHIARKPHRISGEIEVSVNKKLEAYWSPEQICGRFDMEDKDMASIMTIYNYLATQEGSEYRKYLRGPGAKRMENKKKFERIHDRAMITERPREADERMEEGHWEGDTIRGPMKSAVCIMTMVDRKSLYLATGKMPSRKAKHLNEAVERASDGVPLKTLTVDNGMEFASHKKLSGKIGADIYFAHEGCPWERGLNENTNGLLRQFFPKGRDLESVSETELANATELINNRPRKSLGFKTPNEVMGEYISSRKQNVIYA